MTKTWEALLKTEKQKDYFQDILAKLKKAQKSGKIIYPENQNIFNAFKLTPFDQIKVVIMGQDPYHGPNQAHGLCFSVQKGIKKPPSLVNIFKELKRDLNIPIPENGCLDHWSKQGVLLLNESLTVEDGQAGSHQTWGWSTFIHKVLSLINEHTTGTIFLLWGSHAQKHAHLIDKKKHHILTSSHPSPLSAHRGFLGCGHFSKTNELLKMQGKNMIRWEGCFENIC